MSIDDKTYADRGKAGAALLLDAMLNVDEQGEPQQDPEADKKSEISI